MNLQNKWKQILLLFIFLFTLYLLYLPYKIRILENVDLDLETIDYVLVLGAKVNADQRPSKSLQYRIDAACSLFEQSNGVDLTFVATGGKGNNEPISEAEVIKRGLESCGVDSDAIKLEDQSENTYQNLVNSQLLIDQSNVIIVTSDFHIARAHMLANRIGLDAKMVSAKTPRVVLIQSYIREYLAFIKSFLMDR